MSWRSIKFLGYNRTEEKEEVNRHWSDFFSYDPYEWNDFDEYGCWGIDWWNYPGSGSVNSMNEYHTMKLLTLLRKFNIRTAKELAKYRGW